MENPSPPKRRYELDTLADVKRALAQTVRKLRGMKIEAGDTKLATARINQHKATVYALATLADVIERADIEPRLQKLEERTAGNEAPAVQ